MTKAKPKAQKLEKPKNKTILPRNDQVFIKVDDAEARVNSYGIVLPDEVEQERKSQGTVIAVGSKIEDLKAGDHVIYGAYSGEKLTLRESEKKVDYVICVDSDVIALIK